MGRVAVTNKNEDYEQQLNSWAKTYNAYERITDDWGCALMRPDESIEDVLEQIALERIALDAPIRARHGLGGGPEKTQAELSGEERSQFFPFEFLVIRRQSVDST